MLADLETLKAAMALVGLGAVIYYCAVGIASKLPTIRFERGSDADRARARKGAETRKAPPNPAEIQPVLEALAAALKIRNQIAAKNAGLVAPPSGVPLREAILTREMLERGPVKDAPFIPWSDEATGRWLADQGFKLHFPVHIYHEHPTGNLKFAQPLEPEKYYVHGV